MNRELIWREDALRDVMNTPTPSRASVWAMTTLAERGALSNDELIEATSHCNCDDLESARALEQLHWPLTPSQAAWLRREVLGKSELFFAHVRLALRLLASELRAPRDIDMISKDNVYMLLLARSRMEIDADALQLDATTLEADALSSAARMFDLAVCDAERLAWWLERVDLNALNVDVWSITLAQFHLLDLEIYEEIGVHDLGTWGDLSAEHVEQLALGQSWPEALRALRERGRLPDLDLTRTLAWLDVLEQHALDALDTSSKRDQVIEVAVLVRSWLHAITVHEEALDHMEHEEALRWHLRLVLEVPKPLREPWATRLGARITTSELSPEAIGDLFAATLEELSTPWESPLTSLPRERSELRDLAGEGFALLSELMTPEQKLALWCSPALVSRVALNVNDLTSHAEALAARAPDLLATARPEVRERYVRLLAHIPERWVIELLKGDLERWGAGEHMLDVLSAVEALGATELLDEVASLWHPGHQIVGRTVELLARLAGRVEEFEHMFPRAEARPGASVKALCEACARTFTAHATHVTIFIEEVSEGWEDLSEHSILLPRVTCPHCGAVEQYTPIEGDELFLEFAIQAALLHSRIEGLHPLQYVYETPAPRELLSIVSRRAFEDGTTWEDFDEARDLLERELEARPNDANTLRRLGTFHNSILEHERALEYFQRALAINPDEALARLELARLRLFQGEHDLALDHAWDLLSRSPRLDDDIRADVAVAIAEEFLTPLDHSASMKLRFDPSRLPMMERAKIPTEGIIRVDEVSWNLLGDFLRMGVLTDIERLQGRARSTRALTHIFETARALEAAAPPPQTFTREQPKVGRNAPCPCGSGKKYKKCCMRKA